MLELQLKLLDGSWLKDETVAFTLAVATRAAIAKLLGIETDELGCGTKEVRVDGGVVCRSILVFDNNASGYVSSIGDRMETVLREAAAQLRCPKACDGACQHCLDDYDNRYQKDLLNRHAALGLLSDEWLRSLQLPRELAFFGVEHSVTEFQTLTEAIWRELTNAGSRSLTVFLHGSARDWDLPASSLRSYLHRWLSKAKPVTFVLTTNVLQGLSAENKQILAGWASLEQVTVALCEHMPVLSSGTLLAQVDAAGGPVSWASDNILPGHPSPLWGLLQGQMLVRGRGMRAESVVVRALDASELMPASTQANSYRLEIADQWNGSLQGFGDRFWHGLLSTYPELNAPFERAGNKIIGIAYRDRYLNAPLPTALLLEAINALRRRFEDQWDPQHILVQTVPLTTHFTNGRYVWSDWTDDAVRKAVIEEAFSYCGIDGLDFVLVAKYDAEHARTLDVVLTDGSALVIRLDQGMSYWKANRPSATGVRTRDYANEFDLAASVAEQGTRIAELRTELVNPAYPTYLYANWR